MDHANDQNHLFELNHDHKVKCDWELCGEEAIAAMLISAQPLSLLLAIIAHAHNEKIKEIGGSAAWAALSNAEQAALDAAMLDKLCLAFGTEAYIFLFDDKC